MFKHTTDVSCGIVDLIVTGRSNFDDYQNTIPSVIRHLQTEKFDKLLIEIKHLDAPADYIDPDFDFWTINELKSLPKRIALAAPKSLFQEVAPLVEVVEHAGTPVKLFGDVESARAWLRNEVDSHTNST